MPCVTKFDMRPAVQEWMIRTQKNHGMIETLQSSPNISIYMLPHFLESPFVMLTPHRHSLSSFEVVMYV